MYKQACMLVCWNTQCFDIFYLTVQCSPHLNEHDIYIYELYIKCQTITRNSFLRCVCLVFTLGRMRGGAGLLLHTFGTLPVRTEPVRNTSFQIICHAVPDTTMHTSDFICLYYDYFPCHIHLSENCII